MYLSMCRIGMFLSSRSAHSYVLVAFAVKVLSPSYCLPNSKGVWSSRLRLYPEGLYEVSFPVPPLDEQREIAAWIADETSKLDALMAEISVTITLLKERRAALIAAAVAGLIDVERAA